MYKVIVMLVTLTFLFGCGKSDSRNVVAKIDGKPITMSELNEKAEAQLKKFEGEVYKIKRQTLDMMIEEKLIEAEAKKKGLSTEDFLRKEIEEKLTEPSEIEVKKLYEQHKGPDTKPYAEIKPQIEMYLKRKQLSELEGALLARLKKDSNVIISLEPPRASIKGIDGAPFIGPKNAKVTIVEFSDYQCPFCSRVRSTIWKIVEDKYKDKVKYVFMDFPLSFHKDAQKAHEAAHCAGDQDKYFDYNKKIFQNQQNLGVDELKGYAKDMGLDSKKFDECLDKGKFEKTVQENIRAGMESGVNGTPAFFINGIMLSGAQPYEAFEEVIEAELNN